MVKIGPRNGYGHCKDRSPNLSTPAKLKVIITKGVFFNCERIIDWKQMFENN